MGHPAPPALTAIRQCGTIAMYTFIETKLFSRLIVDYMTDDDYAALQCHLAVHPESGDVIQGSGGVRKMRWAGTGRAASAVDCGSSTTSARGKGRSGS